MVPVNEDAKSDRTAVDMDELPDYDVEYLGCPYPRSKRVGGTWYFRRIDGIYKPFAFQHKVLVLRR